MTEHHPSSVGLAPDTFSRKGRRCAGSAAFLLALLLVLLPAAALAAPTFPPLTGRVVDNAQLLSPEAERRLTDELAKLEAQTGHQLVVATLPDLQGYEIEEYGYQLGRKWAIGRKGEDDGAILLVAPKERKVRIEVGYGLEPVLTDALSSVIIQSRILPHFRDNDYEAGILDGAEALVQQLALPEDEARARVQAAETQAQRSDGGGSGVPVIFVIFILFWMLAGITGAFGGRRRRRGSMWWLLPLILSSGGGGGRHRGGGWGGGGGFSGGGGSFGGGGASGSW